MELQRLWWWIERINAEKQLWLEDRLENWSEWCGGGKSEVLHWLLINHPLPMSTVKAFLWAIAIRSCCLNRFNSEIGPGDKWFRNFNKSEKLTNMKPDNVVQGNSRMASITVFKQHFNLLEKLDKLDFRKKLASIFNCGKSLIVMDRRTEKVVASRKTKQVNVQTKEIRDHITASACVSASGSNLPPSYYLSTDLSVRSMC